MTAKCCAACRYSHGNQSESPLIWCTLRDWVVNKGGVCAKFEREPGADDFLGEEQDWLGEK